MHVLQKLSGVKEGNGNYELYTIYMCLTFNILDIMINIISMGNGLLLPIINMYLVPCTSLESAICHMTDKYISTFHYA